MTNEPPKRPILEELLKEGWVYIHLNPQKKGVQIPQNLKKELRVVLQIGYDMPVPIPDLLIDELGIHATLSFSRTPFSCEIPWKSIFAIVSNKGRALLWPHDIPQDILSLQDKNLDDNLKAALGIQPFFGEQEGSYTHKKKIPNGFKILDGGGGGNGGGSGSSGGENEKGIDGQPASQNSPQKGAFANGSGSNPSEKKRPVLRLVE